MFQTLLLGPRLAALFIGALALICGPAIAAFPKPLPLRAPATPNGNTTSYKYQTGEELTQSLLQRRGYTPPDTGSGSTPKSDFDVLLNKKGFTPKGKEYPVQVVKSVPNALIAKRVAKMVPLLGNIISAKELFDELFPTETIQYDPADSRWEVRRDLGSSGYVWHWQINATGTVYTSPAEACSQGYGPGSYGGWRYSTGVPENITYPTPSSARGQCVQYETNIYMPGVRNRIPFDTLYGTRVCPAGASCEENAYAWDPISPSTVENELNSRPSLPPVIDPLIYDLPPEDVKVLSEEIANDSSNKTKAVPLGPGGIPSTGLVVPESTSTTTGTNPQGQPQTVVTQTDTIVSQNPDGSIQHSERSTTTTTTTTGTDSNGNPITSSTTSTTTTDTPATPPQDSGSSGSDSDDEGTPTDTPFPPIPKLYDQKYPNGLKGVWNDKKDQLMGSPIGQLINVLLPNIGDGGQCPSWQIDLSFSAWADFGVHDISVPCWVWEFARLCVIVGSLLLARALIFGG